MDENVIGLNENHLIAVYEIPEKLTDGYCFQGGKPIVFLNVDWMHGPEGGDMHPDEFFKFLKSKPYIKPEKKYLLLCPEYNYSQIYSI